MFGRYLYKRLFEELIMGATEALSFLDVLKKHGLLTRRTVAQYVLRSLYAGPDMREGTAAYEAMEKSVYREVFRSHHLSFDGSDKHHQPLQAVSSEAADYLSQILTVTSGDRRNYPLRFSSRYDGFSQNVYDEVAGLLGTYGHRYLGVSGSADSLFPGERRVRAFITDEAYADQGEVEDVTGPDVMRLDLEEGRPPDLSEEIKLSVDNFGHDLSLFETEDSTSKPSRYRAA
jgi:hypothetical protein